MKKTGEREKERRREGDNHLHFPTSLPAPTNYCVSISSALCTQLVAVHFPRSAVTYKSSRQAPDKRATRPTTDATEHLKSSSHLAYSELFTRSRLQPHSLPGPGSVLGRKNLVFDLRARILLTTSPSFCNHLSRLARLGQRRNLWSQINPDIR